MKYITSKNGVYADYEPYFAYLSTMRDSLPDDIYSFAADKEHYDLKSHKSLHDAWIEQISIREICESGNVKLRSIEIHTSYLGPYHDLRINIVYYGVGHYRIVNPREFASLPKFKVGHGDVITHEIRFVEEGLFEHEIEFSRGTILLIQFRGFFHSTEKL